MRLALTLSLLFFLGQNRPTDPIAAVTRDGRQVLLKPDGTWIFDAGPQAAPSGQRTLEFQTGVVMKNGDVKTVARSDFALLDRDLLEILKDAGYGKSPFLGLNQLQDQLLQPLQHFYWDRQFGGLEILPIIERQINARNAPPAMVALRQHTVQ